MFFVFVVKPVSGKAMIIASNRGFAMKTKKPFGTQLLSNFIIDLWFHFWQKFFSWKFVKVGKKFFGIF